MTKPKNKTLPHWEQDVFPIEGGGHTYLGFHATCAPKRLWWGKYVMGTVKPVPASNFQLLTDELKDGFRKMFAENGYQLEELDL